MADDANDALAGPNVRERAWAIDAAEVAAVLTVDLAMGLTSNEAAVRLASVGPNELVEARRRSTVAAFHAAVAFAVGGLGASRGRAVGVAVLALVAGYVMNFLLPLASSVAGARRWSPWWWAIGEQPVSDGVNLGRLLLLGLVTAGWSWSARPPWSAATSAPPECPIRDHRHFHPAFPQPPVDNGPPPWRRHSPTAAPSREGPAQQERCR